MNKKGDSSKGSNQHLHLLLIEDNVDHQWMVQKALTQTIPQVQIRTCPSGAAALEQIANWSIHDPDFPALILLDLYCPRPEDGLTVLEQLRQQAEPLCYVPVVILSGSTHEEDIRQSYSSGANMYTPKPGSYREWLAYFDAFERYWLQTVSLPNGGYDLTW